MSLGLSNKIKFLLLALFIAASCAAQTKYTNEKEKEAIEKAPEEFVTEKIDLYPEVKQREEDKTALSFTKGDMQVTFGGMIRVEYYFYHDMDYLNDKVPDEVGAFKQTVDLTADIIYGQKKFGHKAFETFFDLKSKNKWGVIGAYRNATSTEVKLGDLSLGEHDHKSSRAVPWFKDAWMQCSFNSVLGLNIDTLHFIKLGWFPFQLGRGIAFGPFYGTIYEELGLYSYLADASAPGIKIGGDLIKDKLSYDLYYAKFEDKSSSVGDTYNTVKQNHVGRYYTPWRGEAKDDDFYAARLEWEVLDSKKFGKIDVEPYIFYNEASDQKVEVKNDCKTVLGSYGLAADYRKSNFKMGGEITLNYGHENLYSIDRNAVIVQTEKKSTSNPIPSTIDGTGTVYQAYSKVIFYDGTNVGLPVPINDNVKASALKNQLTPAGVQFPDAPHLTNAKDRIRPAYKNDFDGWMGVLDFSYKFPELKIRLGAELAYASGDSDPHEIEKSKTYHGFIGLHELYNGRRVKSAIIAGEREIPWPASLIKPYDYEANYVSNNPSFSDMKYIGFKIKWKPAKFRIQPNVLFFWRDTESYKYVLDTVTPKSSHTSDEKASKYMGTELNIFATYELLKDLTLLGVVATFMPGGFYKDTKGIPLKDDLFKKLGYPEGYNVADYRISDDTAYFADVSLTYKF